MVINGALQVHESEIRVLLFLVWIWGIIWARFVVNTGLRLQYGGTTKEAMPAPDSWFVQSSTDRYILWWRHYHFMKSPGVFGTAIEKFRVSWWYTGVSELPGRHFYLPIRPRNSPKPIAHSDGWWSTEYRTRNRDGRQEIHFLGQIQRSVVLITTTATKYSTLYIAREKR